MDSSKPLGSTTWSDPQLGAKMVFNLLRLWTVYHIRAGNIIKQTDFISKALLLPLVQTVQGQSCSLFCCCNCFIVCFRWTNFWAANCPGDCSVWMCFCAQCKPKSEVQIHWSNTLTKASFFHCSKYWISVWESWICQDEVAKQFPPSNITLEL